MAKSQKQYEMKFAIGAKLEASYPKAFKNATAIIASYEKAYRNSGGALAVVGKAATYATGAITAAVAAGLGLANSAANAAENLEKTAESLGMSTEKYAGYERAARHAGMSAEQFANNVTGYQQKLASMATSAKDPLEKYGLSAKKLYKMGAEQGFERVADFMNEKIPDAAKRSMLMIEMFGKQGAQDMERMFKGGSKGFQEQAEAAAKYEFIWTDANLATVKGFKTAQRQVLKYGGDIKNMVGMAIMPAFTRGYEKIQAAIESNMPAIREWAGKIQTGIDENLPKVEAFAGKVYDFGVKCWEAADKVAKFLGGWGNVAKIAGGIWALNTAVKTYRWTMGGVATAYQKYKKWEEIVVGWKLKDKAATIYLNALYIKDAIIKGVMTVKTYALAAAQGAAAAGQWLLNAAVAAFPVFLIIAAIAAMAAGFVWLYKHSETFRNGVDALAAGVVAAFEILRAAVAKIPAFFVAAWEAVKNTAAAFVESLLGKFAPLVNFFSGIGEKIGKIFGGTKTLKVETVMDNMPNIPAHADGGIFARPHIAQIAERGAEAVVPTDGTANARRIWETAGQMNGFTDVAEGAQSAGASGGTVRAESATRAIQRQSGGDGFNITYSPNITIKGGATKETVEQLVQATAQSQRELEKKLDQWWERKQRRHAALSFA